MTPAERRFWSNYEWRESMCIWEGDRSPGCDAGQTAEDQEFDGLEFWEGEACPFCGRTMTKHKTPMDAAFAAKDVY